MTAFAAVRTTAERLRPRVAVVLGSGLSGATAGFVPDAVAGYAEVSGLVPPTVAGHQGQLAVGNWAGVPALVFAGRIHFYEGHPRDRVTRTTEIAAEFGAKLLVLTNAAGGIHPALGPGSLMVIRDHIKLLDRQAWKGLARPTRGRTATPLYSPRLIALLRQLDPTLHVGTYAAVTGPCYETPAEIRALAALGADAVGMSTAVEAEAAAALGLEVCGLSSVTNRAAGLSAGVLTHAEVEETAQRNAGRVGELIGRLLMSERGMSVPRG